MIEPRYATKPLEDILVVALEQAVAAPMASARLAEAGARVIKLERAEGDFARGYDQAGRGASSYFVWLNQGKESLVVDIKNPDDLALVRRLLLKADVFIQNLAVGAAARAGLAADDLRAANPRLITCDISGYGDEGPYADMKAYDLLVQAESGLVSVSGAPGPYGRVGVSVADIATGQNAALGIMEALHYREKTGQGAHLSLSLFDVMADWMCVPLLHHDNLGKAPERVGLAHPSIAPYGAFMTASDVAVLISIQSDREWRTLLSDVLVRPDLLNEERYATNVARVKNRDAVDGLVQAVFATLSLEVVSARLKAARIAYGVVNDVAGLSRHPQLRRREGDSPAGGVSLPASPLRRSYASGTYGLADIGEQSAAIRAEFAEEEIQHAG